MADDGTGGRKVGEVAEATGLTVRPPHHSVLDPSWDLPSAGADVRDEPVDQPYGYREWSSLDPEGGFWSFMQPLG